MDIYIMRHGKTFWNEQGRIQGQSRNRLSHNGRILVEQVSNECRGVDFDIIFSSPLMRTMQTSNIMNKYHNVKIVKEPRLIEVSQGDFTGRFKSGLTEEEKILKAVRSKTRGMEGLDSLILRTKNFYDEIKSSGYNKILIVTHNYNSSILEKLILNQSLVDVGEESIRNFKNAELKIFKI